MDISYNISSRNLSHVARRSHSVWTTVFSFSVTIAPSQSDLKLHDTGSALAYLSSRSPSPVEHEELQKHLKQQSIA